MKQTRVNVRSVVNATKIRRERRAGRDVIIVPSATLPDDIVMNGARYPAAEIEKSYHTLEGTPAPLGHPDIEGEFVSASDPRGMVRGFIGAWNENVRREGGRVFLDKVIDVDFAKQLEGGRAVLEAIEKGDPIHTSTGLYAMMQDAVNDDEADRIATDIVFDHDALLLGEIGAATPEQGVGMLVNARDKQGNKVEVINSIIEDAERQIDWGTDEVIRGLERIERATLIEKVKSVIMSVIRGGQEEPPVIIEENAMAVTDEQFEELRQDFQRMKDEFDESVRRIIEDATKPIRDAAESAANAAKAKDDAELTDLRAAIVKSNLMDEAGAAELTLNAARSLAPKAIARPAYGLNSAMSEGKSGSRYTLPE